MKLLMRSIGILFTSTVLGVLFLGGGGMALFQFISWGSYEFTVEGTLLLSRLMAMLGFVIGLVIVLATLVGEVETEGDAG